MYKIALVRIESMKEWLEQNTHYSLIACVSQMPKVASSNIPVKLLVNIFILLCFLYICFYA